MNLHISDICIARMAARFRNQCPSDDRKPLLPELDDLALGCLLLASENDIGAPVETMRELGLCLDSVSRRFWGDQLVWLLAMESCALSEEERARNELSQNLSHHSSNIRSWMFKLGWLVRHRLELDEVVPNLLENVASTLGYWEESLGLCRALFGSDEEFEVQVDAFTPEDHAAQYEERVDHANNQGYAKYLYPFETMELRLRRQIAVIGSGPWKEDGS